MRGSDRTTRRRVLRATGVAGIAGFLAGCTDDGNGEEPGDDNGEDPGAADPDDPGDDEETEDENGESAAIEPDTRIVLDAQTAGWVGVEPDEIADEENPTLTLTEGEAYEIGWEEGDGSEHNIEIWDENDDVVDDLETDVDTEGGDDQFLEFEASDEMAAYVCEPHETTMIGDLEIESNGNGADEENGDEDDEENGTGDEENGDEDGNDDE